MCELQWDVLAEIYLKNQENSAEVVCLCTRVFIRKIPSRCGLYKLRNEREKKRKCRSPSPSLPRKTYVKTGLTGEMEILRIDSTSPPKGVTFSTPVSLQKPNKVSCEYTMDIFLCTPQDWVKEEETLLRQLGNDKVWDKIPLLNVNELRHLKDGTLVKFRGMIQDMHSPEYFLEKYEIVNTTTNEKIIKSGKYHNTLISEEHQVVDLYSKNNVTAERQTFVVVSVPGINEWVRLIEEEKYKISINTLQILNRKSKRSLEEVEVREIGPQNPSTSISKKCCTGKSEITHDSQTSSKTYILNFPLPDRIGKACHLKVYKDSSDLKLNDTCEFVGFLDTDPLTEAIYQQTDEMDDMENKMEMEVLHPPSSLIPRIHCVSFKKIKHNNPLLGCESEKMDLYRINFIRKELLIVLTQLLLGDELAAEYLICHLISEVYLRRDLLPLGKFSLNISNIPSLSKLDYVKELYNFIELLMPKSHYLPMTLTNMNDLSFVPKKDYECNRLTSGILQLSDNTHLVLDETKLSAGRLNAAGVNSLKALENVIKNQKVTYDFNYYPLEFNCDIPFLILSEGKSMLNADVHIPLRPENICLDTFEEIVTATKHFLRTELLNDIRKYLTLARMSKYEICGNAEALVENEFVNMRQRGDVTVGDLHSLLVLARLLCISEGKTTLDEENWKKACKLEEDRKARVTRRKYNKENLKQNVSVEQSASEDDVQNEEDISDKSYYLANLQTTLSIKNENDHETVSCYCSASHTDNFSTDEHDSLRETHELNLGKGIQQSDSGTDLTEHLRQDVDADWNRFWSINGEKLIWQSWIEKYSAYINPEYLQYSHNDVGRESDEAILSATTDDGSTRSKPEKFLFDEKEVQIYNIELRYENKPCLGQHKNGDLRNRILARALSGSDEKLSTEVSEGWNPLSPLSIDCETEAERLLSSRCGSHASSSLRTVDSMTNVTRMTVSSLDLSNSTSSSDSFSSVSSVNSSLNSEESEEDYQGQWNVLWKTHYEEEYLHQYNTFVASMLGGSAATGVFDLVKVIKSEIDRRVLSCSHVPPVSDSDSATYSQIGKKLLPELKDSTPTQNLKTDNKTAHSLDQLFNTLSMCENKVDFVQVDFGDENCERSQNDKVNEEFHDMRAMGLPTSFGNLQFKKTTENTGKKVKSLIGKSNNFESGRNRVKAAFNLLGIEFREIPSQSMTGQVNYKMKHIRLQNRHLKMRSESKRTAKHTYFDDDGNPLPKPECSEEIIFHNVISDSSDNKLSSCDEEKLTCESVTPFKFEDKVEDGPQLKQSWYSVTPEQVAKHAAERCQCDVIVDAFCGAGGNTIQFALTCNRVIAIDIDAKKIDLARNNAKVYGVTNKIDFIVGDFFQLADTLIADVVFLSPPWGGPAYLGQPIYELEEMLQPVPLSQLLATARKISMNVAAFLPRNSNTYNLVNEVGVTGRVEIEQDFLNKKLVAITAYYNDLIQEK
ncbi:hypothetical protein NQ315_001380 [Exocentrus adspersus]|uniref:Mini-chromosome maintenance complex-binding protein n=1 Tax=Exocentrus adspersus TaxID=1586481 RepID=A0AAV8WEZ3_9CUCU|nr:hypothetical protein NQ315_001380 [Exocentrus adspersus]